METGHEDSVALGARLRAAREAAGLSLSALAARTHYSKPLLGLLETGRRQVKPEHVTAYADALGIGSGLFVEPADGEQAAAEWIQRIAASDLGGGTLERLELAVDDLAAGYATTPPRDLLARIHEHLGYAGRLIDSRKTLTQHRRLLVTVGWLSLLASTCHIDLSEKSAAAARGHLAWKLADEAGHREIAAWCLETRAWQQLTDGEFAAAAELSRAAQSLAPEDSSVFIQATAQEGRALARLGDSKGTYGALRRVARLVSGLSVPDRPEHHFRYDPAKSDAYVATTLAWLGDPAAESYARHVLADLTGAAVVRPRRIASANLDLGLALVAADKPDEAAHVALAAVESGRLVPSNYWRVSEVVSRIEDRNAPDAATVREAFRDTYRA
ncbi:helix-turn-helix transcriptional regulator [Nocardia sp. CDC159]|uniref:Helix-turn-helix transcriptional regulator n=1 Tax=Nocardia pulmonis TaxID=2951408 RepID=A0A9X2EBI7_9NOCA|nr:MULTISPECIES: helix-turn-helix transcriptional regulator [Nocardia]MCM6776445.1 helix-turn-helix transcriptional regulator [Nocardia pulmonis]MCM6788869.1 helix-turn-helix transcriptional regulator [Nocardia sp. CDC159]